ncbi:hypothetical protein AGMMS50212_08320 [Spirochaetia bacterium]|nr:hypothetical protein AGMMS50212_08320 [Spirochaetia bacterium]
MATGNHVSILSIVKRIKNIMIGIGYEDAENNVNIFIRLGLAAVIVIIQALLIALTWHLAKIFKWKVRRWGIKRFKPIKFKKIVILETKQIHRCISFLFLVAKWIITIFQLFITIPIIFSFFTATKDFAATIFGYILTPVKSFVLGFLNYIPNLFAIIVILIIARYALRALKFFTSQIERKRLVVPGFYPEWASPTSNILRVLIIAFTVVIVYPHLPHSDSDVFKGVSVLVGILFSLGSSSIISNIIAGLVMTYMRPFKKGDRIKINDITGFVVEKGPMVTRIRTHKNEYVSFPNQMILNTSVTNFNSSVERGAAGLIVYANITMGYDVPWETVHKILINAALKTAHTEKYPVPFVNQLKLDDFYCWYEINVYTKDVSMLPLIYTNLYQNIQDGFAESKISLYAPHFQVQRHIDAL